MTSQSPSGIEVLHICCLQPLLLPYAVEMAHSFLMTTLFVSLGILFPTQSDLPNRNIRSVEILWFLLSTDSSKNAFWFLAFFLALCTDCFNTFCLSVRSSPQIQQECCFFHCFLAQCFICGRAYVKCEQKTKNEWVIVCGNYRMSTSELLTDSAIILQLCHCSNDPTHRAPQIWD